MERTTSRSLLRRFVPALVGGLALAGCGGDDDFANNPRPPAPIVVTAVIASDGVSVSPGSFGAGPVNLVVTNQTDSTQQITLQGAGGGANIEQTTGPINPRETASLKADLTEGEYSVGVNGEEIDAATLEVGPERASAQNELLQP